MPQVTQDEENSCTDPEFKRRTLHLQRRTAVSLSGVSGSFPECPYSFPTEAQWHLLWQRIQTGLLESVTLFEKKVLALYFSSDLRHDPAKMLLSSHSRK